MSIWLGTLTVIHTLLSIAALLDGMETVHKLAFGGISWSRHSTFIATALATSITGFLFPFHGVTPAIAVGVVATIVLVVALIGRPKAAQSRGWAIGYSACLIASEYFLFFVAVAQAFTKIPALHALAPTLKEPAFGIVQIIVLLTFVTLAILTIRRLSTRRGIASSHDRGFSRAQH
ncbi:hypothetical protein [Dyella japonica]|uniref:hypothetical protein n=1 Tax=Dyella japonica TaxID=231455 RepID=UPI0003775935|nr:hypothetical protein [Dyella japonica]